MSYSNGIRTLLDIQDQNIVFDENCIQEGQYKGKPCKYITGKLTYHPTGCEACGIKKTIIRYIKTGHSCHGLRYPLQV